MTSESDRSADGEQTSHDTRSVKNDRDVRLIWNQYFAQQETNELEMKTTNSAQQENEREGSSLAREWEALSEI
jgi:hypothetical protein